MNRSVRKVTLDGQVRHHSTIRDEPSDGPNIRTRQFEFLNELVVNGIFQKLLHCGPIPFDTFKMYHDGSSWVVDMEALEEIGF